MPPGSFQVVVDSNKVIPDPPFLQAGHPQLAQPLLTELWRCLTFTLQRGKPWYPPLQLPLNPCGQSVAVTPGELCSLQSWNREHPRAGG